MSKPKYRKLLAELLCELGSDWQSASATVICRTDNSFLVQCISCQSSNFSPDYVPATFVDVLARSGPEFRIDFGGRLRRAKKGDLWIDGSEEPPTSEVLELASAQAIVPFTQPLTIDAVVRYLDKRRRSWRPRFESSQWWSAGVVYGLCGRIDDARKCLNRARKLIEELRSKLDTETLAQAEWIPNALADIEQTAAGLEDRERFLAHHRKVALNSARKMGLRDFGRV